MKYMSLILLISSISCTLFGPNGSLKQNPQSDERRITAEYMKLLQVLPHTNSGQERPKISEDKEMLKKREEQLRAEEAAAEQCVCLNKTGATFSDEGLLKVTKSPSLLKYVVLKKIKPTDSKQ